MIQWLKPWANILFIAFCAIILLLSIRGLAGNPMPKDLNRLIWKDNGPLELSPERGRYALTYAIAESSSFAFSPDLARFAAPDVAYTHGKYVSLFAPAVSFIVVPGYLLGKLIGMAQLGTFAVISIFALINVLFIRAISMRLGAHPLAAAIASVSFLFGSPAFSYAVTLYQHHISTAIILCSIYLLIRYSNAKSLVAIWALCALSISVDYPNFFMMLPIGVFALGRFFILQKNDRRIQIKIPLLRFFTLAGVILPLAFFFWFNNASYGNPFQLSGTIERSVEVKANGSPLLETEAVIAQMKAAGQPIPKDPPEKSALAFFQSRLLLNGFYIHFFSPDRGMIMYTPVMIFGIFGLIYAVKRKMKYVALLTAVIGFNVLLYSMWTDPYGGWAFGSRYLIPTYAILSIFIAILVTKYAKNLLVLIAFFLILSYSISINTVGALTSNRNPPQVEAAALSEVTKQPEPFTYVRNFNLLNSNISKSYIFETYAANNITAWHYFIMVTGFIIIVSGFLLASLWTVRKERL